MGREFPDIVTVEECDRDDEFKKIFEPHGYACHFTEKLASAAANFNGGVQDKVGIFYNTEKFTAVCGPRPIFLPSTKKGMMYEKKEKAGVVTYKAAWGKQVAMWILLRNKRTGRLVAVMVAHNKSGKEAGEDKGCKKAQSKRLADILSVELGQDIPILFGCDFNNGTETESYKEFRDLTPQLAEAYEDVYGESPAWGSSKWRNAGGQPEKLGVTPNNIDFLFYSRKYFQTLAVKGYPTEDIEFCNLPGFKYPTDHFAHMAIYRETEPQTEKQAVREQALFLAKMQPIKLLTTEELKAMREDKTQKRMKEIIKQNKSITLDDARKAMFENTPVQFDKVMATPMTVCPSDNVEQEEFSIRVNLRRKYDTDYESVPEYKNVHNMLAYFEGELTQPEKEKLHYVRAKEEKYINLLIDQEIELRKHNPKRSAMEKFDLEYSSYVLMCNYLCCPGKEGTDVTRNPNLQDAAKFSEKMVMFGERFVGTKKEDGQKSLAPISAKLTKSVTNPQNKTVDYKQLIGHFIKAYSRYGDLSPSRRDKKQAAFDKIYRGICAHKDVKVKKWSKEDACTCTTCGSKKNSECDPDAHQLVLDARRRRLGDSAAYLLDRHRQIHGVRIPTTLAALLAEIEEAHQR